MTDTRHAALTRLTHRADGALVYASTTPLPDHPAMLPDRLEHWAQVAPDRLFLAKRDAEGEWRGVTFSEAWRQVRSIAQALIERDLSAERPIVILSGNSVEHALLALAGQLAGAPAAAISPAYSLQSIDFKKLRHVLASLTPGLVFAQSAAPFAAAIDAAVDDDVEIVAVASALSKRTVTPFANLVSCNATAAVNARRAEARPDDVAKFLFTSGSTGLPKAVPNTHRMLCANQAQTQLVYAILQSGTPPVLVDWLPWNHTFGGNQNLGIAVYHGGTLYIDDGRPSAAGIEETVRNLGEVAPTMYFNVPKGYQELLPRLQANRALAERFFSRLAVLFYAGASLPEPVWRGFPELAESITGRRMSMFTGLGATETAPSSINAMREVETLGEIGVPLAGVELKLVPHRNKLELRIRGANVMPGYWRAPKATAAAFDEEGYYKIGDAVKFIDPSDPDRGLRFDGRIAEDFKLTSGAWVSVAALRLSLIAHFAPLVRDALIVGADREDIRALLLPDVGACREAAGLGADVPLETVCASAEIGALLGERLKSMAATATGSSNRIVAVTWLVDVLSIDAGEITDKGSLNAALILDRRPALIHALYGDQCDGSIVAL